MVPIARDVGAIERETWDAERTPSSPSRLTCLRVARVAEETATSASRLSGLEAEVRALAGSYMTKDGVSTGSKQGWPPLWHDLPAGRIRSRVVRSAAGPVPELAARAERDDAGASQDGVGPANEDPVQYQGLIFLVLPGPGTGIWTDTRTRVLHRWRRVSS